MKACGTCDERKPCHSIHVKSVRFRSKAFEVTSCMMVYGDRISCRVLMMN